MANSTLDKFRVRRELWIKCLSGDDRHSVMRQIGHMVWNTAAWRMINEARRLAPPAEEGGVELNGLTHRLIDDGFFEGQMLAIRRLTDSYPITGHPKGYDVYSLTSLLEDMKTHPHLMTRENIFAAEERPYDYEPVKRASEKYCREQERAGKQAYWVPHELVWERHEERHTQIDVFAGFSSDKRSPSDAVLPVVMERLKEKVRSVCEELRNHADMFVAHAASPGSRQAVNADAFNVTLDHLYKAHESIIQVANFVDSYFLGGGTHNPLAVPQYDHLAYIDHPLVTAESIAALHNVWDGYDKETHGWTQWGIAGFRQECPGVI